MELPWPTGGPFTRQAVAETVGAPKGGHPCSKGPEEAEARPAEGVAHTVVQDVGLTVLTAVTVLGPDLGAMSRGSQLLSGCESRPLPTRPPGSLPGCAQPCPGF